jgi:hypothetical protein
LRAGQIELRGGRRTELDGSLKANVEDGELTLAGARGNWEDRVGSAACTGDPRGKVRLTVNIECCRAALVDEGLREIHRSYFLYADTAYRDCNVQLQEGCMGGVDNGAEGDVRVLQSRGVSPSQNGVIKEFTYLGVEEKEESVVGLYPERQRRVNNDRILIRYDRLQLRVEKTNVRNNMGGYDIEIVGDARPEPSVDLAEVTERGVNWECGQPRKGAVR